MLYFDGFDSAEDYAASALSLLKDKKIAPCPPNFQVWYAYFSGRDPELKKKLDDRLSQAKPISSEECEEIFANYFQIDKDALAIGAASDRIGSVTDQIIKYVRASIGVTGNFDNVLTEVSDSLGSVSSSDALGELVKRLANETKEVHSDSKKLVGALAQSKSEITELRRQLECATSEALTDALTGLGNRRYFDERLNAEIQEHQEDDSELCLLLVDIDHFKRFNDTHGHAVGDQVLRVIARVLTDRVRGRDSACRFGGEEFAIILPETKLEDAETVANQIRTMLAARKLTNKSTGADFGTITASLGVASHQPGEPMAAFVDRADKALYRAKNNGRNQVVVDAA